MATPEEKRIDELLSHLIVLSEQVRSAVDEAEAFKSECSELGTWADRLSDMLRFTTSAPSLYERPIRRVVPEVSRNLEQALALVRKCKPHNILSRVLTVIGAAEFKKIPALLELSLGDLKWLLSVFDTEDPGPSLSGVRTIIVDRQSKPMPDHIIKANNDLSKRTRNLPKGGLLEVSDRVYVFDYCLTCDWSFSGQFTVDWLKVNRNKFYMRDIVGKLQDRFSAASFMVLNFGEQDNQSQMAEVLSEYDITVMKFPHNYGGCPIPRVEIIHNFLISADEWLSSEKQQNVLLMHCETGAWPVLAFMLASLLLYRKKWDGEQKTLDMIYKKAPHELLRLTSTLNPLPSQLRYLHYVSTQNAGLAWPPQDKALVIKSVVLRSVPNLDAEGGCRPIVMILGRDPFMVADQTAKVLFSTPRRSEYVRHYKQADGETDKLDIHCNVQGDVVLECVSLDANLEHGELMFRAMFNTAFVSDNVLKLELDGMDVPWDRKDQLSEGIYGRGTDCFLTSGCCYLARNG